jgi:hypothetical protein
VVLTLVNPEKLTQMHSLEHPEKVTEEIRFGSVRVYLVGYIFCIIDYHICQDIFDRLYILYNRLPYMLGYI